MYEELCWDYDDELVFTHDGKRVIVFNKTQEERMSGDYETYEWHETPYGEFRVEKKRFGTWTSYGKDGTPLITGLTRELSLKEHRSISKASLQIGQTAAHLTRMTGLLEENYETN